MEFAVAKQVDHIIEVTRSRPFAKCTDLFAEHLFEGVTMRGNPFVGCV
jgi:hypothetical protein